VAAAAAGRLPKEEDSRAADRAGPPVSEGRRWGKRGRKEEGERWAVAGLEGEEERCAAARPEGGGREVGRGWAQNRKWPDSQRDFDGILTWGFFLKYSRLLKGF
jgi:hypothetical protein